MRELQYQKQGSSGDNYQAQLPQRVGANRKHARREVVSPPCTKPSGERQAEVSDWQASVPPVERTEIDLRCCRRSPRRSREEVLLLHMLIGLPSSGIRPYRELCPET